MRAIFLTVLLCVPLLSCAAARVEIVRPDGTVVRMSETLYAHQLSTDAFSKQAETDDACFLAAEKIAAALPPGSEAAGALSLAVCGLSSARDGQAVQVPVFNPGPSGFDRFLAGVQAFTPWVQGGLNYAGQRHALDVQDRANERNTWALVEQSRIGADREVRSLQVVGQMGTEGARAVRDTAGLGFVALEQIGTANAATLAGANQNLADVLSSLPPTTEIHAGGDLAIAGRDMDQSTTGGHRVTGTGNETDTTTTTDCTSTAQAAPANSSANGQPGATGTTGGQSATTNPNATATTGPATATTNCQPRSGG